LAISKAAKEDIIQGYRELLDKSECVILAEYRTMPMQVLNNLRNSVRNSGGTLRAAKNTLAVRALREAGLGVPEDLFAGSTVLSFSHGDVSAVAKAVIEFAKANGDKFTVKGAVMGKQVLSAEDVKALASLPPLNVLRGQLIGVLQAPAARLIGVLSAPGRQIATVLKAYADKAEAPAEPEPAA
jgi:large subunit ribosomal protein L10